MTTKPKLAKKQTKVLGLLEKGKTPTQVAKAMGISVNGIYGHMRRIEAKGYTVPRKGDPKPRPSKAKASTNGAGSVGAIDAGISKLIEQADSRQKEIKAEVEKIASEQKALSDRHSVLHNESAALETRRKTLASV